MLRFRELSPHTTGDIQRGPPMNVCKGPFASLDQRRLEQRRMLKTGASMPKVPQAVSPPRQAD